MAHWKTCSIRTCVGLYCCAALELQLQAGSAVEPAVVAAARSWHRDYWAVGLVAGAALAVWYTSFLFPDLAILLLGTHYNWHSHLPLVDAHSVFHCLD